MILIILRVMQKHCCVFVVVELGLAFLVNSGGGH